MTVDRSTPSLAQQYYNYTQNKLEISIIYKHLRFQSTAITTAASSATGSENTKNHLFYPQLPEIQINIEISKNNSIKFLKKKALENFQKLFFPANCTEDVKEEILRSRPPLSSYRLRRYESGGPGGLLTDETVSLNDSELGTVDISGLSQGYLRVISGLYQGYIRVILGLLGLY